MPINRKVWLKYFLDFFQYLARKLDSYSKKQMEIKDELRHLLIGVNPSDIPEGLGIVEVKAYCPGNADVVLCKSREVLEVVLRQSTLEWLSEEDWEKEDWEKLLPEWFVQRCPQEKTEEEEEQWLQWWRGLDPEEQQKVNRGLEWTLSGWIAWFFPDEERQWFWWDATVESNNLLQVEIEIKAWPFPWGSLAWLLRASGAITVEATE
jgi:hypothetical protein